MAIVKTFDLKRKHFERGLFGPDLSKSDAIRLIKNVRKDYPDLAFYIGERHHTDVAPEKLECEICGSAVSRELGR